MHPTRNIPLPHKPLHCKQQSILTQHKKLDNAQTARQNKNTFSFSPTNFETYPQNYQEDGDMCSQQYGYHTSKEESEEGSVEETSFEEYLHQVSEELELKTVGIDMAVKMVEQAQNQKKGMLEQLRKIQRKLRIAEQRIIQLQQQVSFFKSTSSIKQQEHNLLPIDSTTKKSITKMVITNTKLPQLNQNNSSLKQVSVEMFKQYALAYDQVFENMNQWMEKEKLEQEEMVAVCKLDEYVLECEDILAENKNKKYFEINQNANQRSDITVPLQSYNKLLENHKQYQKKMQYLLSECLSFIQKLSCSNLPQNSYELEINNFILKDIGSILPPELLKIITKQIHKKYENILKAARKDNRELKKVLEELIAWVKRNLGENKVREIGSLRAGLYDRSSVKGMNNQYRLSLF